MQYSEAKGAALADVPITLHGRLLHNVRQYPDTLALICPHQQPDLYGIQQEGRRDARGSSGLRWTYAELDAGIDRLAQGLQRLGIDKNSVLLLLTGNSAEYILATWAAYRIGCIHVPLNSRCLTDARQARHMFETATKANDKASKIVIIAGTSNLTSAIDSLVDGWSCHKFLVEGCIDGWTSFEELISQAGTGIPSAPHEPSLLDPPKAAPNERSIFFTSGTTSLPKGCFVQPNGFPTIVALSWQKGSQPMHPGDRLALPLPNNHAFGYKCLMAAFYNAATIVFPGPAFSADLLLETIRRESCDHAALVPTMIHALHDLVVSSPSQKPTTLRRIVMAGAPPSKDVILACLDDLGTAGVENFYGMTEGIALSTDAVATVEEIVSDSTVSIGRPLETARIKICAQNDRTALPIGSVGEIHFSGPSLIDGYIGNADAKKFYTDADGHRWFCTGDKAVMGVDGRTALVGRYSDTIIRGGENIDPAAIEAFLGTRPEFDALETQIVRAQDSVAGEVPVAVVRHAHQGEDLAQQLMDVVRRHMGALYVPAHVISLADLNASDYPRTLAGKIQKTKLVEMVAAQQASAASATDTPNASIQRLILEARLRQAWAQSKRVQDPSAMDLDLSISKLGDVQFTNSVRRQIWRELASEVSYEKWKCAGTIREELELIEQANITKLSPERESHEHALGLKVANSLLAAIRFGKGGRNDPGQRMADLGIDSITSIALLSQVRKKTGYSLPSTIFFLPYTLRHIIDRILSISHPNHKVRFTSTSESSQYECFCTLIHGTPQPGRPSLFLTPPGSGYPFSYEPLPAFADGLAVYALGSPFLVDAPTGQWTVEQAAALYVAKIRQTQPHGPYLLGGWSMGAILAYEEACQLRAQRQEVIGILNLDMPVPRPHPAGCPDPTVPLLTLIGFYPPVRRAGQPDLEIPLYRREHSLASVQAKRHYTPQPVAAHIGAAADAESPVRICVLWAGHGDPDRLPEALHEAEALLQREGPETESRVGRDWLERPRHSFGPCGWDELVGEGNVECEVIPHAHHDTMMDPDVVSYPSLYHYAPSPTS